MRRDVFKNLSAEFMMRHWKVTMCEWGPGGSRAGRCLSWGR